MRDDLSRQRNIFPLMRNVPFLWQHCIVWQKMKQNEVDDSACELTSARRQLVQSGTGQYTRNLAVYQIPIRRYQQKLIQKSDEHHTLKVLPCSPFIPSQQHPFVLSLHLFMFTLHIAQCAFACFLIFCLDFFQNSKLLKISILKIKSVVDAGQ